MSDNRTKSDNWTNEQVATDMVVMALPILYTDHTDVMDDLIANIESELLKRDQSKADALAAKDEEIADWRDRADALYAEALAMEAVIAERQLWITNLRSDYQALLDDHLRDIDRIAALTRKLEAATAEVVHWRDPHHKGWREKMRTIQAATDAAGVFGDAKVTRKEEA